MLTRAVKGPKRPIPAWAIHLGPPHAETARSRRMARVGGVAAVLALVAYLVWRAAWTLPVGGWNRSVAWTLFDLPPVLRIPTMRRAESSSERRTDASSTSTRVSCACR